MRQEGSTEMRMGPEEKKQHSMNISEKPGTEGEWREKSLRTPGHSGVASDKSCHLGG